MGDRHIDIFCFGAFFMGNTCSDHIIFGRAPMKMGTFVVVFFADAFFPSSSLTSKVADVFHDFKSKSAK